LATLSTSRVVVQHVAGGIAARRAVVDAASLDRRGAVIGGDRRVVAAIDGDAQLGSAGVAPAIDDGVGEHFVERLAALTQGLDGSEVVVDGVGVAAVGVDQQVAVQPAQRGADAADRADRVDGAGVNADHRQRIAFGIGVVVQHIAAGVEAGLIVVAAPGFDGGGRVGIGHRRNVAATNDDVDFRQISSARHGR
jgi:hypothetical protein